MTSTDCATLQPDAPLPDRKIPSVQETHQLISLLAQGFPRVALEAGEERHEERGP